MSEMTVIPCGCGVCSARIQIPNNERSSLSEQGLIAIDPNCASLNRQVLTFLRRAVGYHVYADEVTPAVLLGEQTE